MEIRQWFTKKRIIWGVIILVLVFIVGSCVSRGSNGASSTLTERAKKQDIKQSVLATGQVVSKTDLELSFKGSGNVDKVNVAEGQTVKAGDVLAQLDQKDELAALTSARGQLAQASANYRKVLDGASSEEVIVAQRAVDAAQVTLDNAKTSLQNMKLQQDTAVSNALRTLLNTGLAAEASPGNINTVVPTVSGTYTSQEQGTYALQQEGSTFSLSGLEVRGNQKIETSFPVPLGTRGLFVQFPAGYTSGTDRWTVTVPNTKASGYVGAYATYQAALETRTTNVSTAESAVKSAEVSLSQAQASLDLKRAAARPADLQGASAQVLSAQGSVQSASARFEDTLIRAPADGVVTKVDVKVGELAKPQTVVMVLQDVGNLHVEANVSEANVASVKENQAVDFTFDALGPDRHFPGKVRAVNPASTVVSGVVNYKVTFALEPVTDIKPGMTANVSILVAEKQGVLTVPSRAVLSNAGKKTVRVVTDTEQKTYAEREVSVGLEGDGGVTEVTSGLSEGDEVVTFIKK